MSVAAVAGARSDSSKGKAPPPEIRNGQSPNIKKLEAADREHRKSSTDNRVKTFLDVFHKLGKDAVTVQQDQDGRDYLVVKGLRSKSSHLNEDYRKLQAIGLYGHYSHFDLKNGNYIVKEPLIVNAWKRSLNQESQEKDLQRSFFKLMKEPGIEVKIGKKDGKNVLHLSGIEPRSKAFEILSDEIGIDNYYVDGIGDGQYIIRDQAIVDGFLAEKDTKL